MARPFKTEYVTRGKSKCECSSCKKTIQKGSLRIGKTITLDCADKESIVWYHVECFFREFSPVDTFDIEQFEQLRWTHQEEIKDKMKSKIFDKNSSGVEYLGEDSTCTRCACEIQKNEIVFFNKDIDILICLKCFERTAFKQFLNAYEEIGGFLELEETDQNALMERKLIDVNNNINSECIKEQNEIIYGFYDQLNKLKNCDLLKLLEYNKHTISPSKGRNELLARCVDMLMFGNFHCEYCKSNEPNYTLTKFGYECHSYFYYEYDEETIGKRRKIGTETVCGGISKFVENKPFEIPDNLLRNVVYERRIPKLNFYPPLYNMKFFIGIKPTRGKKEMEEKIACYGGIVVFQIQKDTTAVISNESDIQKNKEYISTARENNVFIISEDFIDESFDVHGGANFVITSKILTDCGVNPHKRQDLLLYAIPENKTSTIKNKLDVESLSGLEQSAHIYTENENIYTAVLIKTDVNYDINSYYKLQLLESDETPKTYKFLTMWGRIGTKKGGHNLKVCKSLDEAKKLFCKKYKQKSKNNAFSKIFYIDNRKYTLANTVDSHNPITIAGKAFQDSSNLDDAVKEVVKIIFNEELMNKTVMKYEYNTNEMPLGKLKRHAFRRGYELLCQIKKVLTEKEEKWSFKIACLTNDFYKQIPNNFGIAQPQFINNFIILEKKETMLRKLQNAQFIYEIIYSPDNKYIDDYYEQLQSDIHVIKKDCYEYQLIEKYLKNGHGRTHPVKLDIQNVIRVKRSIDEICDLHNHKLLWHGSRKVNFANILSKGLLITPVGADRIAPAMFGKGIYFADVATKSAHYCGVGKHDEDNRGLLLLCEVALGDMHVVTHSTDILPNGKNSIKGLGKIVPSGSVEEFGFEIPIGELQETDIQSEVNYNEYVVFDPAQVRIRYLVAVNFH